MFNMHLHTPTVPPLKRKSFDDLSEPLPKKQAVMSPIEPQQYHPASRSFGALGGSQVQLQPQPHIVQTHSHTLPQIQPVSIQPRPAPNGVGLSPSAPSPTVSTKPLPPKRAPRVRFPTGRKRGRPSKADKEEWARQNATQSQSTAYTPIIPAPIAAPQPPSTFQHTFSISAPGGPIPSEPTAHRAPSNESVPEPTSHTKGLSPGTETHHRPESAPGSLRPTPTTDLRGPQAGGLQRYEQSSWRDSVLRSDQRTLGEPPTPMEPRISHGSPFDQHRQHSHSPFAPGGHRESMGPAMEPVKSEGYPAVTNQA